MDAKILEELKEKKDVEEVRELAELLIQLPQNKRESLKEGLRIGKILYSENEKKVG